MPIVAQMLLLQSPGVPAPVRGAALLGLVLAGGAVGIVVIVSIAWMRRRRAARRGGTVVRAASPPTDAWRESARRVRVDPDDGEPFPPVDPRDRRA
jgi:hypothetical protein